VDDTSWFHPSELDPPGWTLCCSPSFVESACLILESQGGVESLSVVETLGVFEDGVGQFDADLVREAI